MVRDNCCLVISAILDVNRDNPLDGTTWFEQENMKSKYDSEKIECLLAEEKSRHSIPGILLLFDIILLNNSREISPI